MENVVKRKDINRPVSFWIEKERFEGIRNCLTIILRTKGCYWNKCLMCGYSKDADRRVEIDNLKNQIEHALKKCEKEGFEILKIFTSGSFFDDREIPSSFREYIYSTVRDLGLKKLIVESRPEFVTDSRMREISADFTMEVGIGLETSDDFIRENCINKGFTFEDFVKASAILRNHGIRIKVYLLLKPPFLSENEAIKDVISSAKAVKKYADVISLNLTNIPSGTYIEMLWKKRLYRPPWLWSAVEAMKMVRKTGIEVISDPVAAGKQRGPHNCGKCDYEVADAIRRFSLTQNEEEFDNLYCKCIELWKRVIEVEDFSRIPLVK